MNDAAFDFIEVLIKKLVESPKIELVNFKDLAENMITRI
jgi:hypothetical protein